MGFKCEAETNITVASNARPTNREVRFTSDFPALFLIDVRIVEIRFMESLVRSEIWPTGPKLYFLWGYSSKQMRGQIKQKSDFIIALL